MTLRAMPVKRGHAVIDLLCIDKRRRLCTGGRLQVIKIMDATLASRNIVGAQCQRLFARLELLPPPPPRPPPRSAPCPRLSNDLGTILRQESLPVLAVLLSQITRFRWPIDFKNGLLYSVGVAVLSSWLRIIYGYLQARLTWKWKNKVAPPRSTPDSASCFDLAALRCASVVDALRRLTQRVGPTTRLR